MPLHYVPIQYTYTYLYVYALLHLNVHLGKEHIVNHNDGILTFRYELFKKYEFLIS